MLKILAFCWLIGAVLFVHGGALEGSCVKGSCVKGSCVKGSWAFIYYANAPSSDGGMPPPVFDTLEVGEGTVTVGVGTREGRQSLPAVVTSDSLSFTIPVNGGKPIDFKCAYEVSKDGGTLSIIGSNSTSLFVRKESLEPNSAVAAKWSGGTPSFEETMELGADGLFKLHHSRLFGFYRLWRDRDGVLTLTLLAAHQGGAWHTFLWQVRRDADILRMTPIGHDGPRKKFTSEWRLLKE